MVRACDGNTFSGIYFFPRVFPQFIADTAYFGIIVLAVVAVAIHQVPLFKVRPPGGAGVTKKSPGSKSL